MSKNRLGLDVEDRDGRTEQGATVFEVNGGAALHDASRYVAVKIHLLKGLIICETLIKAIAISVVADNGAIFFQVLFGYFNELKSPQPVDDYYIKL